ncbi:DUF397 domain-containing protein [Streptomyces sp. PSKA54]|uniref:DUF397 domain-containing protein n=1 Tax=Streptomyces himalayensis subsp. aureolus TaxID=2758039 RepID=A0A7W2CYK9_9ACTN|nr:DUF397 domain-containing protein [Streptomyces himalayensis]MBA4861459.1 DUF397 domain-containing protein [Streptomyces himalayensis subsp. aureolus]
MTSLNWQKSSYCQEASACLHLASASDGTILLRESDKPEAVLTTGIRQLSALVDGLRHQASARGRR